MAAYSVLVDMAHPTVKRLWRTLDVGEPRMGSVSFWPVAFVEVKRFQSVNFLAADARAALCKSHLCSSHCCI